MRSAICVRINRAQRWDWYYRYGFYTNDNDGSDLTGIRAATDRAPVDVKDSLAVFRSRKAIRN